MITWIGLYLLIGACYSHCWDRGLRDRTGLDLPLRDHLKGWLLWLPILLLFFLGIFFGLASRILGWLGKLLGTRR